MFCRFVCRLLAVLVLVAPIGCETADKSTPNLPDKDNPPPPPGGMKGKSYPTAGSRP